MTNQEWEYTADTFDSVPTDIRVPSFGGSVCHGMIGGPVCHGVSPRVGYGCTRPRGHGGRHAATITSGLVVAVWRDPA